MKKKIIANPSTLRQRAIDHLEKSPSKIDLLSHSEADLLKLIHELEVHKVELEIMNEELKLEKAESVANTDNYINFYDSAPSGYITLSSTGLIENLNLTTAKYLGEDRSSLVNSLFSRFISHDTKDIFFDFLRIVFKSTVKETCEITLAVKDQPPLYVHLDGKCSDDGEHCLVIFQNITALKVATYNLEQSNNRYKSLFLNNHTVMLIIDPETGSIVDANPIACNYYGWTFTEICQKNISDINTLTPEELFFEMNLAKVEKRKHFFFKHRLASGEIRQVEVHSGPIKFGNTEMLYSHIQDITERRLMENTLRESEEKYRNLVENINDVIFEIDTRGKIKYISSTINKIIGYTSEEITGKKFTDFVGQNSEHLLKRLALLDKKKELEEEYQIFKKTGEPCWIRLSTKGVYTNGVFQGGSGTLIDITERKHSDEALSKSSQKWEAILATSTDGLGMVSLEGKIQLLSDKIAAMYGYTPEEKERFIGGSFFEFIDASCHNQLIDNNKKLLEGIKDVNVSEYIAVKKDKSRFDVELNSTVLRDSDGNPESILYFQRDITERKVAENILKESERKFKLIIQSQAEGIGVVNQDEIFEFVNPAAAKIFETTVDELLKTSLFDYLSHDEIEKINNQTAGRRNGATNDYELQIVTKAGNNKFIEVTSSPKLDENNNYCGAYGVFRDITDRKLAQEALREKSTLLSNLIVNMQEGILLEDSNCHIVLTNELFCNMFSIPAPPTALVGADCSDSAEQSKPLFKDPEKFVEQIQNILNNRVAVLSDELELADGRYFERDYIPTYLDNAYNGHLWKYRDITERKLSQQKISQQNERLNAIITAMPDLIFVMDQYGNSMEYYTNTPDKLLAPEDKVVGLNIETLFDQKTTQFHLQKINECIEHKSLVSYEYLVDQADSLAYYEARLVPLGTDKVLAFIRDVSENKQKDDEIKKLYLAIEQSPVSILITDLAARIEYVNPAFLATTGYTRGELIGNNPRILKSGKTDKSVYHELWKTITAGKVWEGEWQDKKKNGELFWEHVSINPIITENGKITNYLGVKQDITLRKQAEDEIRNLNATLEDRIKERTLELSETNDILHHEIAQRKLASATTAEALGRLQKISDLVPGMVYQFMMNPDGTSCFPYASEGISDIYGVTPDEVAVDASIVFKRLHPDDQADVVASIQQSARDLTLWRQEYRIKFDDGTVNWLFGNALPQLLPDGAVLWHGFITDITGNKQMEAALFESEHSYKTVLENIKEIIFQTDADGLWLFLNKAWEEVTGFSVEESLGQLFINYVHPDDRQRNMELFQPLISRQKDYCRHQVRYLTKDGGFRWIEVYARLGLNEQDEIIGTYGTLQDITERKEAEDNLKQLSFRLSLAVQAGGVGVWDFDLVNDRLIWDDQMFELYGIKREDFSGAYSAWQHGLHPDDKERGDKEIQMAISGEKTFDTEFRVIWPDDSIHNIRALAVVQHDPSGKPVNVIGTNWDITAQKRAAKFEQELLNLSIQLTGIPSIEISAALDKSLRQIGTFLHADRAYIFEFNLERKTMSSTHEWCNEGILTEMGNLQEIPYDALPMWMRKLQWRENILITSIHELPDSWRAEREMFEPRGIQSLLVIPILSEGNPIGFVRLDAVSKEKVYDDSEINFLKVWSNMLSGLINNQNKELELNLTRRNYETFFNTIDDFLFVLDEQANIIHTNNSVSSRLGYSFEELINQSVLMVHPAERRDEAGRIVGEMLAGTADFCPVPLLTKSMNQIPVETRVKRGFWDGRPVIFGVSKDVSKIQLSEEKFSKAFQYNSALMAISRVSDNKFIEINDTFINKLDYSREELLGKTSGEFNLYVNSEARTIILEKLNQNIPVREVELEIRKKTGESIFGLFSADFIYIGEELCILAVMVDITERKLAMAELKESRETHRGLSEAAFDSIFFSEKGICIEQNQMAEKVFGYTTEEALGRYGTDWIVPEDRKILMDNMLAGIEEPYEVMALRKDGTTFPCMLSGKMMYYKGRNVRVTSLNDITDRKKAEEALLESEKRFSLFMDYLPALVFIKDFEGRMIYSNNAINKALGASEWLGKSLFDIFNAETASRIISDDKKTIQSGYQSIEESFLNLDGSLHHYETQKFVIPRSGQKSILGGISLDITERKKAEEEIIKSRNEAESANHAKSEFLSRMSHELRTPMNSILGFAQLLQMGELEFRQRKGVNHIIHSGKHLLDLINEVLDISRIEAGRISLALEPIQLNGVILEMIDSIQPQATARNITIKLIDSSLHNTCVIADNQRLKQVLMNLLSNSIKYDREGGLVIIEITTRPPNPLEQSLVRISISDTGIGIAAEDIPKLFTPFERIGAEKTETEGTGLGLTVVKKLMDAMDGEIGVESVPGEGSTFWIELPAGDNQHESVANPVNLTEPESALTHKNGTILYIEDNRSNIELVEQILADHRSNIRLFSTINGKQAVPLALEVEPDLILLDLDLPDINGDEVIALLKAEVRTKAIPVIIISADAMSQQQEKLFKAGARNYLTKPLDVPLFLLEVDKWLYSNKKDKKKNS